MIKMTVLPGTIFYKACETALEMAKRSNDCVLFNFCGKDIFVYPTSTMNSLDYQYNCNLNKYKE